MDVFGFNLGILYKTYIWLVIIDYFWFMCHVQNIPFDRVASSAREKSYCCTGYTQGGGDHHCHDDIHPKNCVSLLENSAENSNFPQKDCLRTRNYQFCNVLEKRSAGIFQNQSVLKGLAEHVLGFRSYMPLENGGNTIGSLWHNAFKRRMPFLL